MIEIVFGYGTGGLLHYAGIPEEDIYCFDLDLSVGHLMEKEYPDLSELRMRAERGEPLRVWYSQDPDEMAGFWWLMSELEYLEDIEIHGIELPSYYEQPDGTVIIWDKWGEVSPEEWALFLAETKPVPRNYRRGCAMEWQQLVWEDAPLRAMVNGKLVSASEKLYEQFLRIDVEPAAHRKKQN